jgi:hypothetical protein
MIPPFRTFPCQAIPSGDGRVLAWRQPLQEALRRARSAVNWTDSRRKILKPDEIRKLDAFFKRTFKNPDMQVKARPRKTDSAEVYVGDEFLGIVFKDEEDGDYNFSMAILEIDLA